MPKKNSTTTNTLVIVESPAKCKKIEQYLGPGYKCLASFGHLTEIPSLKNVDINDNFKINYTIIDNALKKKQLDLLKKEASNATEVILATDLDREGEGIAWNLCQLLKLNVEKTKRIAFNEITETALKNAIRNPNKINMDLVHAFQARQVLDLLVGFKVSPMLWKYITRKSEHGLSAGRCQTPALRLIYENQKEIEAATPKKVYNTKGYFTNMTLPFELDTQFSSEEETLDFLDESIKFNHIYECSEPVKVTKKAPEPFTTSRIQQVASNELHYSPKDTMKLCQTLYEGGYITYMRTDSKTYSKEFIDDVKDYIVKKYSEGEKYINENIDRLVNGVEKSDKSEATVKKRVKKSEGKVKTQDAHEAIRPTKISLVDLPEDVGPREKRMYKLIWENALESCMSDAKYSSIKATISAARNARFLLTSELNVFPGWQIVSGCHLDGGKEYKYLQTIRGGSVIPYKKMVSKVGFVGGKAHYTEARLVQLLEEKGIGRPSTFSSLVDKIQERGYVEKKDVKGVEMECKEYELEGGDIFESDVKREMGAEKNKLVINPLGVVVSEFLDKHFSDIFNYDYTKGMEDELDKISKGGNVWQELCGKTNTELDRLIDDLTNTCKVGIEIDGTNTLIMGKYGPVIKSVEEKDGKDIVTFKSVKKDIDLKKLENQEYKLEDIVEDREKTPSQYILGKHEGLDVILKKGKFGLYVIWGENNKSLKELGNRPMECITLEDVLLFLSKETSQVIKINENLSIRTSKKGEDYIFFKTAKMKTPKFFNIKEFGKETNEDYKTCDIDVLKKWIREKYNVF